MLRPVLHKLLVCVKPPWFKICLSEDTVKEYINNCLYIPKEKKQGWWGKLLLILLASKSMVNASHQ